MKILTMEQGSPEWLAARIGVVTASGMDQIITPAKGDPSASQLVYRARLLAEWFLGRCLDEEATQFMQRGTDMEGEARGYYGFERDVAVQQVGFVLRDDGMVGASPDGLVGDDGVVEIKCLGAKAHAEMLLRGEDHVRGLYKCQRQGQLLVCERKWNDIVLYHPDMPKMIVRVVRDEPFLAKLSACLDGFVADLRGDRERFAEARQRSIEARQAAAWADPDPISGDGPPINVEEVVRGSL